MVPPTIVTVGRKIVQLNSLLHKRFSCEVSRSKKDKSSYVQSKNAVSSLVKLFVAKMSALIILTAAVLLLICYLSYKRAYKNFGYWEKLGVKVMKKQYPFLGDTYESVFQKADPFENVQRFYDAFKDERMGGVYSFNVPTLVIQDLDLIKLVTVKDADYFINKYNWVTAEADPIFGKNLLSLKDQRWKDMRNTLSSVFTSAKIKNMFLFMNQCGVQAADYIENLIAKQIEDKHPDGNLLKMELKGFFTRYTTDVIATTAFGLETDSFKNPENEFFVVGNQITNFTKGIKFFRFMFILVFPYLAKKLKMTFFGDENNQFFISIISQAIRKREKNKIVRPDLIHLLMEARKERNASNNEIIQGKLPDLTDEDIAAQAMLFFLGGFESVANLLCFATYSIAINPEVQEKLHEEIDRVVKEEGGFTYDGVTHKMKYLDAIINETLRLWPPTLVMEREVSKDYTFSKTENSPELHLKRGEQIWILVSALHRDSKYFPNPLKFDPERFSEQNKKNIEQYAYLPFGIGPRHCLGMRFGLLETKVALAHLFKRFLIQPIEKTQVPLKLRKDKSFMLEPIGGFWLGFERRNK